MKRLSVLLVACSSAPPLPAAPVVIADAAVDSTPDAGVPDAVLAAPVWSFRYATKERTETWTIQFADGHARVIVKGAQTVTYLGTETAGTIDVASPTAKLALACKHEQRSLSTTCNDSKAKPIDVLACYHPDFTTPMTFGAAPGIEYVVDATCNGYRLVN